RVLDGAQQTQKSEPALGEQSPHLPTDPDKLRSATSGPDKGPSSTPAEKDADTEVDRLLSELIGASRDRQEALIEKLRDSKGAAHTQALAAAIAQLGGAAKTKARDALAQRLTRMTASTLRDKLQDESPEIRRAAALACAMKEDQQHVKDL